MPRVAFGVRAVVAVAVGLVGLVQASTTKYELMDYDPVADSDAVVLSSDGKARFTVLTDRLLRMEFSESKAFEDRPTLSFVNRKLDVPKFTTSEEGGVLGINTTKLALTYDVEAGAVGGVTVRSLDSSSAFDSWHGGMSSDSDSGNLLGTFRTLDGAKNVTLNCSISHEAHCVFGLVSRSGWAVVNDSDTPVLDADDWWAGADGKPYARQGEDYYLFGHGHDYVGAIGDYTLVGGKMPMVPRFISGVWYTRWYNYNAPDTRKEVAEFASRSFPIDVWVYDMNWHTKHDWTGYSYDRNLFPFPEDTIQWLKTQGLHLAANLHDASGVGSFEDRFDAVCAAMGLDPTTTSVVPLNLSNKTYMHALEDLVLLPLEKDGFDFWWIDWQQGEAGFGTQGGKMNPTIWTDKIRVTDPKRRSMLQGNPSDAVVDRGVVLARWGGLGNHRYQVGFSGDVSGLTWSNLAYQPVFTATAANVLYGHWSHDIEGPGDNPELYTRWIQWATYSGVMRSHDRGMSSGGCYAFPTHEGTCPVVEPWNVERRFAEANRQALQHRAALVPYVYTAMRRAFDTGVSVVHPLYYHYPEDSNAYLADTAGNNVQYMFGDDMMVVPVVQQSDHTTTTNLTVYLPQGTWVERHSGAVHTVDEDGKWMHKPYALWEVPVFVKGGAVIPEKPCCDRIIGGAMQQYTSLVFTVFPGSNSGEGRVYEDDGATTAYLHNQFAWTTLHYSRSTRANGDHVLSCHVTTEGSYDGLPDARSVTVKVANAAPPSSVTVNGAVVPFSRFGGDLTYSYDGAELTLVVELGTVNTAAGASVTITTSADMAALPLAGLRGVVDHALWAKRNLDEVQSTPGSHSGSPTPAELSNLAVLGEKLTHLASNASGFAEAVHNATNNLQAALDELAALVPPPEDALVQLYYSGRNDHCLCGSEACRADNVFYARERVEGYQPTASTPGATPLYDFWDNKHDNFATTDKTTPDGYSPADFSNGYVLDVATGSSLPDTHAIALYYKASIGDHMTVATDAGEAYAKQNNYTLVNGTIGFAYTKQQSCALGDVNADRLDYSVVLLNSAAQDLQASNDDAEPLVLCPRVRAPARPATVRQGLHNAPTVADDTSQRRRGLAATALRP